MTTAEAFDRAAVAMRGTARRSARAREVGVLAGLLGVLVACQGPGATSGAAPQEPASTAAASPAASAAPSAPPATSAVPAASAPLAASAAPAAPASAPGAKAGCVADADCRTHASYCVDAPCACRVLRAADPEPRCAAGSPQVACLVNPCARKAATCQAGRCVLVPGG